MDLILLFICIITSFSQVTNGLQCIDCTNVVFNGSSISAAIQSALDVIPGIRTPNCATATPTSGVKVISCPENPPNQPDKVYSCGRYTGKLVVELPLNIARIPVYIEDRECLLVYKGLKQECHSVKNAQNDAASFQAILSKLDNIGAVSFDGDLCLTPSVTPESTGETGSLNSAGSALTSMLSGYLIVILLMKRLLM